MSWKIIFKAEIDHQKWTDLVYQSQEADIFCALNYVEMVAENFALITNEQYKGGMLIAFKKKFGVKTLYTPKFLRYQKWIGERPENWDTIDRLLKTEFQEAQVHFSEAYLNKDNERNPYQTLSRDELQLNTQAKRMLKKWTMEGYEIKNCTSNKTTQDLLKIISSELTQKANAWEKGSTEQLSQLVSSLALNHQLTVTGLFKGEILVGGLFLMQTGTTTTFLKGTVEGAEKEQGGMYFLMLHAIKDAHRMDKNFDFGGSKVAGVKRFNCNFGAKDQYYYVYHWHQAPFWFQGLRKLNKWLKK